METVQDGRCEGNIQSGEPALRDRGTFGGAGFLILRDRLDPRRTGNRIELRGPGAWYRHGYAAAFATPATPKWRRPH